MDAWTWELMPSGVRAAVEEWAGTVVKAEPLVKGPAPGIAAVLHAADGERYVLKAAPEDSPAAHVYLNEMNVSASMPLSLPAARMRYGTVADGWIVMIFEYLPEARHADLSPGSEDLDGVIAAVGAVSATAAWDGLRPVSENVARFRSAAERLVAVLHDGAVRDLYAASMERSDVESLEGGHLVHYDLHAPNILVAAGQVHLIDWAFGCAGAEGLDVVLLLPRLVAAGHEPGEALDVIAGIPAWRALPVTTVVALWTMFRHYKALRGPSEHRGRYVPSITAGQRLLRYFAT